VRVKRGRRSRWATSVGHSQTWTSSWLGSSSPTSATSWDWFDRNRVGSSSPTSATVERQH
jgi:hypothetical protein